MTSETEISPKTEDTSTSKSELDEREEPQQATEAEDKREVPEEDEEAPPKVVKEWDDLLGSGGIMKKILKEGTPDTRPERMEPCTLNYECALEDGTVVESVENATVILGDCEVVQGLDLALGLMNVGEKCQLKIEARLGYGVKGERNKIPPNANLVYTVELLKVDPEEDIECLSITERKTQGNKKRERGNWWYGRGENTLAVQCYRRALEYLEEVEGGAKNTESDSSTTDAALQELLENRMSVCNNMAAAQIKLGLHEAALNSLQTVLRCQPDNVKALYRKAKIFREKNDLSAALKCLQRANEVAPNNSDIQREISTLNGLIQKQKISERELARRMFSGAKVSDAEKKKKGTSKHAVWGTIVASVVVGLVGLAAYRFKLT